MFEIYTNEEIWKDGADTGFNVRQTGPGTRVWHRASGRQLRLPCKRYALSTDRPQNGKPGRSEFFQDFSVAYKTVQV